MYWNRQKILSYNALLNFVIGVRGGGKTYDMKRWCIESFIKHGKQFVWVRRYNTELFGDDVNQGVTSSFMSDLKDRYENHTIEIKKDTMYIDEREAGYFLALSTSQRAKSSSFPDVDKIIFDEFLIEGNTTLHYIKNEPEMLLELVETVQRSRDDVRVMLLGNALSFANPYFMFFGIKPFKGEFYHDKDRSIVVQMWAGKEFVNMKRKTRFGKLVENTRYGDYAIANEFLLDSDKFIEKRPKNTVFQYSIHYDGETFGFWLDLDTSKIYASRKHDKSSKRQYTLRKEDHDINALLVRNINNTHLRELVYLFRNGYVRFEDIKVKAKVFEILNYFLR